MDKLINYLEFRVQNYGTTKGTASVNSMYYQIGLFRVRVSDHMKYGEDALKENDFYFKGHLYLHHQSQVQQGQQDLYEDRDL